MRVDLKIQSEQFSSLNNFPVTRFMGSKRKLLEFIEAVVRDLRFDSVLDAFSGSGCVSYLFKTIGKQVVANDYLAYCYYIAKATVENQKNILQRDDIGFLLKRNQSRKKFIQQTFNGLYFSPAENDFLDNVYSNIMLLRNPYKKALSVAALCRAAMKKQPRGVFTVVGSRYDDGRRDLQISMEEQFVQSACAFNNAVFDNGMKNRALNQDVFTLNNNKYDLVYIDPPYCSLHSDNDYVRRYHFVEGLATYWRGVKIQMDTRTRRIENRYTPFASRRECYNAFTRLFSRFKKSIILVSYSSNSLPTREEMIALLKKQRGNVKVFEQSHRYSFGNQGHKVGNNRNTASEYLFLGY